MNPPSGHGDTCVSYLWPYASETCETRTFLIQGSRKCKERESYTPVLVFLFSSLVFIPHTLFFSWRRNFFFFFNNHKLGRKFWDPICGWFERLISQGFLKNSFYPLCLCWCSRTDCALLLKQSWGNEQQSPGRAGGRHPETAGQNWGQGERRGESWRGRCLLFCGLFYTFLCEIFFTAVPQVSLHKRCFCRRWWLNPGSAPHCCGVMFTGEKEDGRRRGLDAEETQEWSVRAAGHSGQTGQGGALTQCLFGLWWLI